MRWGLSICLLLAGCEETGLGACDTALVFEIAYDPSGVPAYAGQAQIIQSCGGGSACHAASATDRMGAPPGLDYDLRPASLTIDVEADELDRLAADQLRLLEARGQLAGLFGPGRVHPTTAGPVVFERVAADGATFTPLPAIDTPEGFEILRNWLACGIPVVERTLPRLDSAPADIGFVVAACQRVCVDLTWPDIHTQVVVPTCARSNCHDDTMPTAGLDYVSGGAGASRARLVGQMAAGPLCGTSTLDLVVPGDSAASLFYGKLAAESSRDVCGSAMPLVGPHLGEQPLCAIRGWIDCGACAEADGGACAACVEGRRAECGVDVAAPNACSSLPEPCANGL